MQANCTVPGAEPGGLDPENTQENPAMNSAPIWTPRMLPDST